MTIQVELTLQEEAWLRERAAEDGREPGEFLREMVRMLLVDSSNGSGDSLLPVVDETGTFHEDRWQAVMTSIQRGSANAPILSTRALTREALYLDHN